MIKQFCGNCQNFKRIFDLVGVCRAKPPEMMKAYIKDPITGKIEPELQGLFPPTVEDEWCASWEERTLPEHLPQKFHQEDLVQFLRKEFPTHNCVVDVYPDASGRLCGKIITDTDPPEGVEDRILGFLLEYFDNDMINITVGP